jgi:hypothetical protein
MPTLRRSKRAALSDLGALLEQRLERVAEEVQASTGAVQASTPAQPARAPRGIMEVAWRARAQAALLAEYTATRRDGAHCSQNGDTAAIVAAGAEILAESHRGGRPGDPRRVRTMSRANYGTGAVYRRGGT